MEQRVVGKVAVGPDPEALAGVVRLGPAGGERADVALVDGMGPVEPRPSSERQGASRSGSEAIPSGGGTSGMVIWWSRPASSPWKEQAMLKMASPCWMAITRRVVKDFPSRIRSTSYRMGIVGSPGRRK